MFVQCYCKIAMNLNNKIFDGIKAGFYTTKKTTKIKSKNAWKLKIAYFPRYRFLITKKKKKKN